VFDVYSVENNNTKLPCQGKHNVTKPLSFYKRVTVPYPELLKNRTNKLSELK
jgi:hypothetical protein